MKSSSFEDVCDRFESSWLAGRPLEIGALLDLVTPKQRHTLLLALLEIELEYRFNADENPEVQDYQSLDQNEIVEQAFAATRHRLAHVDEPSFDNIYSTFGLSADIGQALDTVAALLSPSESAGEIGRLGGFSIQELVGQGGMGVVFRATDLTSKTTVALKVMKPIVATRPEAKRRFLREARAIKTLRHPHIVRIFRSGEVNGTPYLAMEYLQGNSLQMVIDQGERIALNDVIRFGKEIASGLAFAHSHDLVHRDIKPSNLWIASPSDSLKILDFGLVRDVSNGHVSLTETGVLMGSPKYMSPEQARAEKVSASSDLFSLGSVLYRLVTGVHPFNGKNVAATLLSIANASPVPIATLRPEVHCDLEELIHLLLQKDPRKRPTSARGVYDLLTQIEQQTKTAPPIFDPPA